MYTPVGDVGVLKGNRHGNAFFRGLATCGSVWACPVCAAKIQERRRQEIASALDWGYANGLQPVMVTLTFPHRAWNSLTDLVLQQRGAFKRLRKGKAWDDLKEEIGYQGMIRALEITHGRNGWHPHTHEIWFVSSEVKADDLKVKILAKWEAACASVGLISDQTSAVQMEFFRSDAVHVKGWCSSSDYLAKADDSRHWGADREMAKGGSKDGRKKGKHPFKLLAEAGAGDERSAKLYVEFVDTMKATRSRQLFWSPGLKGRVGINEKTDEELAEEQREPAELLGQIQRPDWNRIRRAHRAELLKAAEQGGWSSVLRLVVSLRPHPASSEGKSPSFSTQLICPGPDPGHGVFLAPGPT